jgi:hypothetical protein
VSPLVVTVNGDHPGMPSTTETAPKKPTKALLEERAELVAKADSASKVASNYRRAVAKIDERLEAYVRYAEPKSLCLKFATWVLAIVPKKKAVSWKNELVDRCGADVARELEESAGWTDRFSVEPAPKSPR